MTKSRDIKQGLQSLLEDLIKKKKDLLKDARKLIDLSHKVLVFLDSPRPELFNALMPLLSHDRYEVEYEFVDTNALKKSLPKEKAFDMTIANRFFGFLSLLPIINSNKRATIYFEKRIGRKFKIEGIWIYSIQWIAEKYKIILFILIKNNIKYLYIDKSF